MLPVEAGITIRLAAAHGRIERVAITSTRLTQASRLLAGRSPSQVTALLPTLFALCGTAQGLASVTAFEHAFAIHPTPAQIAARRILLLVETVAEHCMGMLRDWPPLLDELPDLDHARRLRPLIAASRRYPDRDALSTLVRQLSAIAAAADTFAARLLDRIEKMGLSGFGATTLPPMPPGGPADLEQLLAEDRDGHFLARPDSGGTVLLTGPLARQWSEKSVGLARDAHGNGLLALLTARRVEVASSLQELARLVHDRAEGGGGDSGGEGSGCGLGVVEAARGLLAHRVEVADNRVLRYQILAPTEWNFHPDGPLVRGLTGAEAGADPAGRARLLAAALDPCVACDVIVE
jgi:coenzyme F420-reducing hydrogenase alpha subunit